MKRILLQIVGWYGVLAILSAYALASAGLIEARSYVYQLLNLTGAVGVLVVAASRKDIQPVVLNIVWAVVAVIALAGLLAG